jgi:hypothetical protein
MPARSSAFTVWSATVSLVTRRLVGLSALFLIGYPAIVLVHSLVTHQTIFGNYPMIARWLAHRYLLGQSMAFFQDEFAGRVSQKVMQTALAIRETVMKLMDVLVYVAVYFIGAVALVGSAEEKAVPVDPTQRRWALRRRGLHRRPSADIRSCAHSAPRHPFGRHSIPGRFEQSAHQRIDLFRIVIQSVNFAKSA